MKLDVLGLEAFVGVADAGGFGRAAEGLHLTQTGLTRRVQGLESVLGVKLLERTTRTVMLTEAGRRFLPRARRLVTDLRTTFTEVREGAEARRGEVTVACVPTVGVRYLAEIIARYAEHYPSNAVRILDHSSVDVAAAVLRREAEFGINISGTHDPELTGTPLLQDRFVVVCHRDHPLAQRRAVTWRQLEPHPLIFVGRVSGNRGLVDDALGDRELRLQLRCEVQRSSTAVGLAAAGLGAAIVPSLAWHADAWPDLRKLSLRDPVVTRSLVLIARRGAVLSPAAQALYDLVAARGKRASAQGRADR
jgi:DNA-binding transcriptional LysR family regulator